MTRPQSDLVPVLGGLDEAQYFAENLSLPVLPHLGAITKCKQALDLAASTRRGVAVVGAKGTGKSVGRDGALGWFAELERQKKQHDGAYRVRRVRWIHGVQNTGYRDMAIAIARSLNPMFKDRVHGRSRKDREIREYIVQTCLSTSVAVLLFDEGEHLTDGAFQLLRDLMADAEDLDPKRLGSSGGRQAAGVGIVLLGDDVVETRLGSTTEAGHRWAKVIRVELLDIAEVLEVYRTWFPGFTPHVQAVGNEAWESYVASLVCRGKRVLFRRLENHARQYAFYMARSRPGSIRSIEEIPFDQDLFHFASQEANWDAGVLGSGIPPAPVRGRRS